MGETIYRGFWEQGFTPGDTPDLRMMLVMSGFTGEANPGAINLDDVTLDEFDGVGYSRHDCAGVAITYEASTTPDEVRFDWTDDTDGFGATVSQGSDDIFATVVYLHVDGTAANDVLLWSTTEDAGKNANGGMLGFQLPVGGFLFGHQV